MKFNESYSIALYEIYKESKEKISFYKDVQSIYLSITNNNNLLNILSSKMLNKNQRKKIIDNIFGNKINKLIKNFLFVLVDNEYIKNTISILRLTLKKIDLDKDQIFVKIETAYKLDKDNLNKILNAIKNKWKKKIDYTILINKELIGGVKIIILDKEIDGSIKGKIDEIKRDVEIKDRLK